MEHIPISDRGFQYGDGLFETIEVVETKPVFLKQHLNRLTLGCLRLKIPPPDIAALTAEIEQICQSTQSAILKIMVTRGSGSRGYKFPDPIKPTHVLSLHPFLEYPPEYVHSGVNVCICSTPLGLNPALAGIKHLNRLEQVLARAEWDTSAIQEGIMSDINGRVIEGTMSNLFYVKEQIIYTASLNFAGVRGIIREIIVQICHDHGLALIEHDYGKAELLAADEVFMCNSIIGIWPIKEINKVAFQLGRITKQLQQWLIEFKARDIADVT